MNAPSYGDRDPIAALATVSGESALAIIRTSGGSLLSAEGTSNEGISVKGATNKDASPERSQSAIELLARVFSRPGKLLCAPGNSIVHGWIVEPEPSPESEATPKTPGSAKSARKKIDEVLVSVYRAPHSYSGEDGADISCHGGIAVVKAVMAALKKAGFREALPGEFTFRAFMNGKLDLTRAESVMELVEAKTHKAREQAVRRLAGVLQEEVSAIKALLVQVLAGTEIYLDYSEDEFFGRGSGADTAAVADDEEAGRLPERKLAQEAALRLKVLAELWRRERIYAEGVMAVIAGRPNAGKSSLFNYLIREDRSIVTDIPGTTRDWIEAAISVEGIPLRLADTAGLRDLKEGEEVERIGIQRSLELLDRADLVLYLIDGKQGITAEDREFLGRNKKTAPAKPLLVLWNKADLAPPPSGKRELSTELPGQLLAVSAKTGEGIPGLMRSIVGLLEAGPAGAEPRLLRDSAGGSDFSIEVCGQDAAGPGTLRQKELIDAALASVEEALALASAPAGREEPLDIIAPFFRSAINSLGEITGEVSGADILEVMFSRFCVGK